VNSDLRSYQQAIATVTADQDTLGIRDLALAASESKVASARDQFGEASHRLQGFAVSEYVSSGLYSGAPLVNNGSTLPLTPTTPKDSDGVVVQQYLRVAASNLISQNDAAEGALKGSEADRGAASKALAQAAVTLTTDEAAENRDLTQLVTDVATLERAGACATVTITPPPSSTAAVGSSTTSTTVPASTTTTTVPPSTTTTTVPSTTTTSTTVPTSIPLDLPTTTTTTTTVPPTTTTTVPPSTTTTVPAPVPAPVATTTAPPAEAGGVTALQGCIATFAPPAGA